MARRTLEEYKREVFDKLDEKTKLEWLYTMSEKLCNIEEYINFLVIINQTINGKFSETQWGQDILSFIEGDE